MSQHIQICRRVLPHIFSKLEVSLFRCSPSLLPGGKALLTTSCVDLSKNWEKRSNNTNERGVSGHNWCSTILSRDIFTSSKLWSGDDGKGNEPNEGKKKEEGDEEGSQNGNDDHTISGDNTKEVEKGGRGRPVKNRGYLKDRTKFIPVEVSMRYIKSAAYKETYGDNLVWVLYRRNFKGQFQPKKTRRTCIRAGQISSGNACPICRDEYLVLHPENVELLKQFISPFNGEILHYSKTGLCQRQHEKLLVAVMQAKDRGVITFDVPFRTYDYSEYQKLYESYKS